MSMQKLLQSGNAAALPARVENLIFSAENSRCFIPKSDRFWPVKRSPTAELRRVGEPVNSEKKLRGNRERGVDELAQDHAAMTNSLDRSVNRKLADNAHIVGTAKPVYDLENWHRSFEEKRANCGSAIQD